MAYPLTTKIWLAGKDRPINDEELSRLDVLVPPQERTVRKKCDYEVLAFVTEHEWDTCNLESEMKKRIRAKFREYDHAEEYAQKLLIRSPYYHKVILRA